MKNKILLNKIKEVVKEADERESMGADFTESEFIMTLFDKMLSATSVSATGLMAILVDRRESMLKGEIAFQRTAMDEVAMMGLDLEDGKLGEQKLIAVLKIMSILFPNGEASENDSVFFIKTFGQFIMLFKKYHNKFNAEWIERHKVTEYWKLLVQKHIEVKEKV